MPLTKLIGLTGLTELISVGGQSIVDRPFETDSFIGLGQMGGGMAKTYFWPGLT
jgi:hypothetical protein